MVVRANAAHLPLKDNSVQCVVTSPPYWGLRKYAGEQDLVWGGVEECEHEWKSWRQPTPNSSGGASPKQDTVRGSHHSDYHDRSVDQTNCQLCGAWLGAFGLEPTIEMYVQHSVEILREVRRVLRPDGVCFWNIGDSYAGNGSRGGGDPTIGKRNLGESSYPPKPMCDGLKPKDLCLVPARVALAAQSDGWWVRSDIIWNKPNAMPESVRDRPTDAYEHIFMFTKSSRYFWDVNAVREPLSGGPKGGRQLAADKGEMAPRSKEAWPGGKLGGRNQRMSQGRDPADRNLRNVWTFSTQAYSGAHFATFPEELVIRCLQVATRPGDTVGDFFLGSGTTLAVAYMMGRRGIGCDLSFEYLKLATDRIPPMAVYGHVPIEESEKPKVTQAEFSEWIGKE